MASNVLPDHRRYTFKPEHRGKPAEEPEGDWFKELVDNEIRMTKLYEEEVVKRTEATTREMMMKKQLDVMRTRLETAQSKGNDLVVPVSKWNGLVDKYDVINAERNSLRDEVGIKENTIADLTLDFEEMLETAENNEAQLNSLKEKIKIDKKAVKSAKKITKEYDMLLAERATLKDEVERMTKQRNEYLRILIKRKVKLIIKDE